MGRILDFDCGRTIGRRLEQAINSYNCRWGHGGSVVTPFGHLRLGTSEAEDSSAIVGARRLSRQDAGDEIGQEEQWIRRFGLVRTERRGESIRNGPRFYPLFLRQHHSISK